jgi:hypothetical protein
MRPRAHPRTPMVRTITVVELNDRAEPAGSSEAQSIDISRGGLAFYSRRLFHVGRFLLIEIPKAGDRFPMILYGTVRHSRYVSGRGHMVGLELAPLPETQEVMSWVAKRMGAAARAH